MKVHKQIDRHVQVLLGVRAANKEAAIIRDKACVLLQELSQKARHMPEQESSGNA